MSLRQMLRLSYVTCLFLLCVTPVKAAVFSPEIFTLANGMQIVIVPHHLSEAIAHMVWYKAGSVDDPAGKSGIAHYLEHMMFKQSQRLATGAYSSLVARRGGVSNAFTSYDVTAYHVQISKVHLPLIMQAEAERMRGLLVDSREALTERSVILREREQRTENRPSGIFYEKLNHLFWGVSAYGRPVIGWRHEIEGLQPADIKNYYQKYYAPNNAVLAISGDVDVKDVLRLAAGTFGRLSADKQGPRDLSLSRPEPLPKSNQLIMRDARVKQPLWLYKILAPTYVSDYPRAVALEILAEILTGGEVGLMYRHFVIEEKEAAFLAASYDPMHRGDTSFSIIATPSQLMTPEVLGKKIKTYLSELAEKGIGSKDIQAAKKRLQESTIFARDSLMAPAQILGQVFAIGLSAEAVESWPEAVDGVSKTQINEALLGLLQEKHHVTGMLLSEKAEAVK